MSSLMRVAVHVIFSASFYLVSFKLNVKKLLQLLKALNISRFTGWILMQSSPWILAVIWYASPPPRSSTFYYAVYAQDQSAMTHIEYIIVDQKCFTILVKQCKAEQRPITRSGFVKQICDPGTVWCYTTCYINSTWARVQLEILHSITHDLYRI